MTPDQEKELVEFIKGVFQCYVGFKTTDRMHEFIEQSDFVIIPKGQYKRELSESYDRGVSDEIENNMGEDL